MDLLTELFARHGLVTVALAVLLGQIGAPLPSTPVLLLAGVEAGSRPGFAWQAFVVATLSAQLANGLWFWAGRRLGRRVLATLCRISISPDSCVRQNEASFARRGVLTLVIAKFVPGLSILAPPLAGTLGMRTWHFMVWNLLGSALWAGAAIAVGRIFHAQIDAVLQALAQLGSAAVVLAGAALLAYLAWRLWRRAQFNRELKRFERLGPVEAMALLDAQGDILFVDVRAFAPDMPLGHRIPGARHLDLGALREDTLADWPPSAELITYCACPNDASAARAALWLRQQGRSVRVLRGGIDAWKQAGLHVETL
ncbi:VTT domain-containing protein [Roseateles asaccharophilus]|uniref:Membrane protein DedA with SNARE-associated domain/rhodanese-related sulfurtransferase n=1 Tax=Roseateles asaccharophilus TaxID=582607 RepID=A0ABU2A4I9_9BURK|nr:VTT domain-containing protein [Roseateles asaccharophilus]MDR7332114.1 membrane protein DedA with SNARE-associated domain/rhodanese-related sulfurtransferase [Roseateles asaccharophilus]